MRSLLIMLRHSPISAVAGVLCTVLGVTTGGAAMVLVGKVVDELTSSNGVGLAIALGAVLIAGPGLDQLGTIATARARQCSFVGLRDRIADVLCGPDSIDFLLDGRTASEARAVTERADAP